MDVTVAVATFGDQQWRSLAWDRAIPSALAQTACVHAHRDTLHEARNAALASVESEWVVFLDADDELEPGFVRAMSNGSADLRAPSVAYVKNGQRRHPGMPRVAGHLHGCTSECLPQGNWLVVGSAVRADLVREVGGWEPWPIYEDWALWLRCWKAGATVEAVPHAVYRAHVRGDSRNRSPDVQFKNRIHREIVAAVLGDEVAV